MTTHCCRGCDVEVQQREAYSAEYHEGNYAVGGGCSSHAFIVSWRGVAPLKLSALLFSIFSPREQSKWLVGELCRLCRNLPNFINTHNRYLCRYSHSISGCCATRTRRLRRAHPCKHQLAPRIAHMVSVIRQACVPHPTDPEL